MLFSAQGRTGSSFMVGCVLGIIVVTGLFTALAGSISTGGESAAWAAWTKIVIGVLVLLVAVRQWRSRGAQATPKWMAAIDQFTPVKAFGLGFLLSAVNPKNLLMGMAAGVTIGAAELSLDNTNVVIAVFTCSPRRPSRSRSSRTSSLHGRCADRWTA